LDLNAEMGNALADAVTRKSMFETATEPEGTPEDIAARAELHSASLTRARHVNAHECFQTGASQMVGSG
jgi:hypothetical protein